MKFWKRRLFQGTLAIALAACILSGGGLVFATNETLREDAFEQDADLTLELLNSVSIGEANADGGVAEIVAYNSDRSEAYVVNGQDGLLYRLTLTSDGLVKEEGANVKELLDGFAYGDMTSIAVDTKNDRIAVALQAQGYADNGRVALLDYDFRLLASYEVGVQPDMVVFSPDGKLLLLADEGEPREGYGADATDPAGGVSIIDLEKDEVYRAGFEKFSSAALAAEGVLIGVVDREMVSAELDLEPEYIAVSPDSKKAYVSLQEANAIAVVDLENKEIAAVKSMGFKDLSKAENAIDLVEDGVYEAKTYPGAFGVYMPDALSCFTVGGVTYLATANEGDAREWGDYCNEKKETLTAADGTQAKKVRVLDLECTAGLDEGGQYLYGGRSFAIYNAETMELVYESGNDFEAKTAQYLPTWFNCSNDNIAIDDRSPKKGPEAEGIVTGVIDDRTYAFVALERIGGVMVYDVTKPEEASYVNYINTRDFGQEIAGDVSPEGLCFLTFNEQPILLAACEVSGTVAAYAIKTQAAEPTVTPEITVTVEPTTTPEPSVTVEPTVTPGLSETPDTGDDILPIFGIALLCGTAAVAVCIVIDRRKEK